MEYPATGNTGYKIMKVKLLIDTREKDKATVGLLIREKRLVLEEKRTALSSQVVLLLIEKILKENNLEPSDLTDIGVEEGPGSFTGIRVGVAIANAFSFALGIPVNGKKEIVVPTFK